MIKISCILCGGPIGKHNKSGICTKNPECKKESNRRAAREWARRNPGPHLEWRKANPEAYFLFKLKHRAKLHGVPFDLVVADLPEVPSHCPCCNVKLVRGVGKSSVQQNSPALDRIKPVNGYVKGNVQWLCFRCNRFKSDASPEEIMRLAVFMNKEAA